MSPVLQDNEVEWSSREMTSWSVRPQSDRADVSLKQSMSSRVGLRAKSAGLTGEEVKDSNCREVGRGWSGTVALLSEH